jgi:hypothetical protein
MRTIKLQCPDDRSGEFQCNAIGQSGTTYRDVAPGSVIDADTRDAPALMALGFTHPAVTVTTFT